MNKITCKEDLFETYFNISNDNDEICYEKAGAIYDACSKLGIRVMGGTGRDYFLISVTSDSLKFVCISNDATAFARREIRKGDVHGSDSKSMGDFIECEFDVILDYINKPAEPDKKINVEYEHLTEANTDIWDLKQMLDDEVLFSKTSHGDYNPYSINAPSYMLSQFIDYGVHRRIETEVTWQSELAELINKAECISNKNNIGMFALYDSNSVECSEFIAMCHLVSSMTDKPE